MRRFILLLAVLFFAAPSLSETCTATGNSFWWGPVGTTVPGGQWAGCTPTADDDFVINGDNTWVQMAADVTLTTGTMTITNGALIVDGGVRFTSPVSTIINGVNGRYFLNGALVTEARIAAIDWTTAANETRITLDKTNVGSLAAGNFVVFGDDDPEEGIITGEVQTSAAAPTQGIYRPSYNKWAWYRIQAVSGNTIDYYHDPTGDIVTTELDAFVGTPYKGTRGAAATGHVSRPLVTVATNTRAQYGFYSILTFVEATDNIITVDTDLGSQYVEWTSGNCSGQLQKILWSEDGGGLGSDTLYVAADSAQRKSCGTGDVRITQGARVGDKVYGVRPAIHDGGGTGYILWTHGTFSTHFASIRRLGTLDLSTLTPPGETRCQICILQADSDGDGDDFDPNNPDTLTGGGLRWTEIAYGTDQATLDTYVLHASSQDNATGAPAAQDSRYANNLLDLSGIEFEYLNIHDTLEDNGLAGSGEHGIWFRGVQGAKVAHARIERLSDDGIGGGTNDFNNPDGNTKLEYRHILSYEHLATLNNTQECVDLRGASDWGAGDDSAVTYGSRITAHDIIAIGCFQQAVQFTGLGADARRWVTGGGDEATLGGSYSFGSFSSASNPSANCPNVFNVPACCPASCSHPTRGVERFPAKVRDSILYGLGNDVDKTLSIWGHLINSILVNTDGADNTSALTMISGSFLEMGDGATTPIDANLVTTGYGDSQTLKFHQSVVSVDDLGVRVCGATYEDRGMTNLDVDHTMFVFDTKRTGGLFSDCVENAGSTLTIDGLVFADQGGSIRGIGDGDSNIDHQNNGQTITNACLETPANSDRDVANEGFGTNPTDTSLHVFTGGIGPDVDDDVEMRAFASTGSGHVCDAARPTHFGLSSLGFEQALLGDLFLEQVDAFSTRDLVKPHRGHSSGVMY